MDDYGNTMDHLYTAFQYGDLNEVKEISFHLYNTYGWNPDYEMLSTAFLFKRMDIVNFFLDNRSCEVNGDNSKNYRGYSALHSAVLHGDSALVQRLIEKGAHQQVRNEDGLLPLHLVAYRNPFISKSCLTISEFNAETARIINTLLHFNECIDDVVNSYTKFGYTALHLAAECANMNVIPILLQAKANFCAKTEIGQTPLHIAVINGNCKVVNLLLKKGVPAFQKDKRGKTPLCWAIELQHKSIIEVLVNHKSSYGKNKQKYIPTLKDDYASILTAVKMGDPQLVNYLLSKGASANVSWKNGMTPMHIAVEVESEEIIKILLQNNAVPTAIAANGKTPLYLAVERESVSIVKILLESDHSMKSSVYLPCNDDSTPLDIAVKKGNEEVTKLLLQAGTMFVLDWNESPLHAAVIENNSKILRILLENPDIYDTVNSFGKTALQIAAEKGNFEIVQEFCNHYSKIDANWKEGYAALYIAALNGRENIVNLLLESGADLDARTEKCLTPLIAAAEKGHLNIVQLLIEKNVDIDETSNDGLTALHSAIKNKFLEIVEFLLDHGADVNKKCLGLSPLHCAAHDGDLTIVKLLLQKDAEVNAENWNHTTPLCTAVRNNHSEIVRYLIENGADVSVHDHEASLKSLNFSSDCVYDLNSITRVRPLLVAVDNGNEEIVSILLQNGCNPDHVGERISPLHLAAANGHLSIVKMLIRFNADLNAVCDENYTPISHAIATGQTETFLHLLSTGVDFQEPGNYSLLHISLNRVNKDKKIIEILLDFGADVNVKCHEQTPLHCAIVSENRAEDEEIFQLLLDYGANVEIEDRNGNTGLHLAVEKGDVVAVKVFLDRQIDINLLNHAGFTPLLFLMENIVDNLNLYTDKPNSPIPPLIRIAKMFVRLIAFKTSINIDTVNTQNTIFVNSENMNSFYNKCKLELVKMKEQKIYEEISYYNILTAQDSTLLLYLLNEEIVEKLKFEQLKSLFPCYTYMIVNHVRKFEEKRGLLEQSKEHFTKIVQYEFPALIVHDIFKYFSIADMKNMYRALYRRKELIMKQFQEN